MPYQLLRRDFIPFDVVCARPDTRGRTHRIQNGKAYIFQDDAGNELWTGPHCALAWVQGDRAILRTAPDFTVGFEIDEDEPQHGNGQQHAAQNPLQAEETQIDWRRDLPQLMAYVSIRQMDRIHAPELRHTSLEPAARELERTGTLTEKSAATIRRIVRYMHEKAPDSHWHACRTLRSVMALYAVMRLTDEAIEAEPEHSDFFRGVQETAAARLCLTQGQADALNAALTKRFRKPARIRLDHLAICPGRNRNR